MIKNINKNSDIPKKISICEKCGNTCEEVESNFILYDSNYVDPAN